MSNCPADEDVLLWSDATGITGLVLSLIWFTAMPLGIWLWYRRRNHPYLMPRSFELNVIAMCGLSFEFISPSLSNYTGRDKFPCDLILFLTMFVLPIGIGPLLVRLVIFANKNNWQNSIKNTSVEALDWELARSFCWAFATATKYQCSRFCQDSSRAKETAIQAGEGENENEDHHAEAASRRVKFFLQSRGYGLLLQGGIVVLAIVCLIASIQEEDSPYGGQGCFGCEVDNTPFLVLLVVGVILYALCLMIFVSLRKRPDPLGIKLEIGQAALAAGGLMLAGAILSTVDAGGLRESRSFDIYYLFNVGIFIALYLLIYRPVLKSYDIDKNRRSRRVSSTSSLEEALEPNTPLYEEFYEYLVGEWSVENALFLRAVQQFRRSNENLTKQALEIYSNFVDPNGMFATNISDVSRTKIKEKMEPILRAARKANFRRGSNGPKRSTVLPEGALVVPRDIFDVAYSEVFNLLYSDSWFRFQNSRENK